METLGIKFEMVDQRLHRGFHLAAFGRGDLATCQHIARGVTQFFNRLLDDFHAFAHLGHAAQIPVITIAVGADGDLKFKLVIAFIRLGAAQIPGHAGPAHHHPGETPIQRLLFRDNRDIDVALFENPVFGQQGFDIVQQGGEFHAPLHDIVQQRTRQVLMHPAGAEIGGVQARTTGAFIKHHQFFAFLKPPQRRGQRADIHRLRGDIQQVVQNTTNLGIKHPDQAGAARHHGACQTFNRQTPGMFLVHRCDVIQPVEIGQVLQIGPALHQLFSTAMQQPDMRVTPLHNLAVQFQHQPQNPMRGGVLRAKVDVEIANALFACQHVDGGSVHYINLCSAEPASGPEAGLPDIVKLHHIAGATGQRRARGDHRPVSGRARHAPWPANRP